MLDARAARAAEAIGNDAAFARSMDATQVRKSTRRRLPQIDVGQIDPFERRPDRVAIRTDRFDVALGIDELRLVRRENPRSSAMPLALATIQRAIVARERSAPDTSPSE